MGIVAERTTAAGTAREVPSGPTERGFAAVRREGTVDLLGARTPRDFGTGVPIPGPETSAASALGSENGSKKQ